MGTRFTLLFSRNWTGALARMLNMAEDGDEVVLLNADQVELAKRAIVRMHPGLNLNIRVADVRDLEKERDNIQRRYEDTELIDLLIAAAKKGE